MLVLVLICQGLFAALVAPRTPIRLPLIDSSVQLSKNPCCQMKTKLRRTNLLPKFGRRKKTAPILLKQVIRNEVIPESIKLPLKMNTYAN